MQNKFQKLIALILITIGLLALESFIKYYLILNKIPKMGFYFFNFLQIGYFPNYNLAFGLPMPNILIIISVIIILIFLCYLWWQNLIIGKSWNVLAVSLIIIGALSNLLDRLFFGYVIDYLNIFIWPVFNMADALIVIGVGVIIIETIKSSAGNKLNSI
jgi:signal peptidase II